MDITGIGAIADLVSNVLDKIFPNPVDALNAKTALLQLQQTGELAQLAAETDLAKGQIAVDAAEAASTNTFASSWRPFVGWIGGIGLAYAAVLEPVARFVAEVTFHYTGAFPVLDTTITMQVLFGLLGLGAMRSFDKMQGTTPVSHS